jgi:hypothetical protein
VASHSAISQKTRGVLSSPDLDGHAVRAEQSFVGPVRLEQRCFVTEENVGVADHAWTGRWVHRVPSAKGAQQSLEASFRPALRDANSDGFALREETELLLAIRDRAVQWAGVEQARPPYQLRVSQQQLQGDERPQALPDDGRGCDAKRSQQSSGVLGLLGDRGLLPVRRSWTS